MVKVQIQEAIVVEGRYDKNALSQVVDTLILETDGFGIFKNQPKMKLLGQVAKKAQICHQVYNRLTDLCPLAEVIQ